MSVYIHPTAIVDEGAQIGEGTKVWHFSHVEGTARIGEKCSIGQYLAQADTSSHRTLTIHAARGEIIDRYGRPLVINREGFNIVFDAAYLPTSSLNETILKLTRLLAESDQKWTDKLPLKVTKPYGFSDDMEHSIGVMKSKLELNDYATAENCANV